MVNFSLCLTVYVLLDGRPVLRTDDQNKLTLVRTRAAYNDAWPAIWRVSVQRRMACHLANRTNINEITNNSVLLYLMLVFKNILLANSIDLWIVFQVILQWRKSVQQFKRSRLHKKCRYTDTQTDRYTDWQTPVLAAYDIDLLFLHCITVLLLQLIDRMRIECRNSPTAVHHTSKRRHQTTTDRHWTLTTT